MNSWSSLCYRAPFTWSQLLGACCCWLLLALPVLGGSPTPYGESFVRLGDTWPDGGPAFPSAQPAVAGAQDGALYQRQLAEMEQAGGPYADDLAEPLVGLGRTHWQLGDIEQALQFYRRALHVIRINEGLYSERQVPVLKELFASYRVTGDMATLDARYDYYFRLYGSGQPPYSAVRLGAALEYLRWQREALRIGLDENNDRRLQALISLNAQLLDGVKGDGAMAFASYRALVLSQTRNYYLAQYDYEKRVSSLAVVSSVGVPSGWTEEDVNRQRMEAFQRSAIARGRELLEELIARTPGAQTIDLAAAYLELADWNQWNDRRREALEAYGQVIRLLQGAGREDLLLGWLGQSLELPANGAFWQAQQRSDSVPGAVLNARYDVSEQGRARNIVATAVDRKNDRRASKLRRDLAQTRFRPRFADGLPVADTGLTRDYELLN